MNILIETSPLQNANAIRGVGRYTRELVEYLQKIPTSHKIFTTETGGSAPIDLVHYPYFDLFFPTLPIIKPAKKTVVTIHDVIPLLFPRNYPKGIRGTLSLLRQRLALRTVSHIITDSEVSKRDIIDHLKISSEKISVVYLAASPEMKRPPQMQIEETRKKYGLPKNYVLYVGDINYNKNLLFLIRVLKKIPKITLVMVGKNIRDLSIPEGRSIAHTIQSLGMEKRVKIIDNLTSNASEELCAIYALARAYVQPSLYEGFGLPVLEAMKCRTPVVCSKAGSLPEVAGDAAIYFHPMEEEDCRQVIEKVLRYSEKQRASVIKKGLDQANQFSWERTAKETMGVYEKIA